MIRHSAVPWLLLGLLCNCVAHAQYAPEPPPWVEAKPPPAPTFSTSQLIAIGMPYYVSLAIGVDPETITVGTDGVVHYVVVMRNASGSTTAAFEGIRCSTDEVKTYARFNDAGQWVALTNPAWKPINGNMPSKHAFAIARQGACDNHLSISREQTITALKLGQPITR